MQYHLEHTYIFAENVRLFTAILLPEKNGKFPTILVRSPYVDNCEELDETDALLLHLNENVEWLKRGYAVVLQHCRGRGKSEGDCVPYIHEREDGLALQDWVRKQNFYNGELFLKGASYLTSVHYATAPFAEDIRGAIFSVQDSERYRICYQNGFLKKALHGDWYVGMYHAKAHKKKNYTKGAFDMLPMRDFTKTVFGEPAEDFDAMLKAPDPADDFWNTRLGGNDARAAVTDAKIPILLTTGFYDLYTGGIFAMWNSMQKETREKSALVVSPYDHGDQFDAENSIAFPLGARMEQFGKNYEIDWFDYIRGIRKASPFATGKVTYYRLFENKWKTDEFLPSGKTMTIPLGDSAVSYIYNPYDAPGFLGGLSRTFGGAVFQQKSNSRHDIVTVYSEPFLEDTFIKGKMRASLRVLSDCEDTCFYVRISITKEQGDYPLRDDITSLCYQLGDYQPNEQACLDFAFDEHAFLIRRGERLRIDIASADNEHYVRHTNNKGLYSEQTTAKIANNTVYLQDSCLILPIEETKS